MPNSCCKGPLVMLNYKSDLFCRAPFLPPHSHFVISAYCSKVLGFSFCELALPAASPSFIIDRFEGICLLLPIDHVSTESLSDIALRRGTEHRPKLNDTGWDRAAMVYADHSSLSTLHNQMKNMIDETLLRIYFSNCKTHLTTRAGLHLSLIHI